MTTAIAVATPAVAVTSIYVASYRSASLGWSASGTPTVGQTFVAPGDALQSWTCTTSSDVATGVRFVVRASDALAKKAIAPPLYSATTAQVAYELSAATGVPEPTTWAMLTVGFGAIGAGLRRRPTNARALA